MSEPTGFGRGRRPVPATVHLLHGNPGKKNVKELEAQAATVPLVKRAIPCPKWIKGLARREWNHIVPKLMRYRIVTELDATLIETYVQSYAQWREAQEQLADNPKVLAVQRPDKSTALIRNPWLTISERSFRQVQIALMQLGLTPSARAAILSRTGAPEPPALPAPDHGNPSGSTRTGSDPLRILD